MTLIDKLGMTPTYFHNLNPSFELNSNFRPVYKWSFCRAQSFMIQSFIQFYKRYSYILPFRLLTTLPIRSDHCAEKWGQTWSLGTEYAKILIIICSGKSKMVFFLNIEFCKTKKQIFVNILILPFRLLTPCHTEVITVQGNGGRHGHLAVGHFRKSNQEPLPLLPNDLSHLPIKQGKWCRKLTGRKHIVSNKSNISREIYIFLGTTCSKPTFKIVCDLFLLKL